MDLKALIEMSRKYGADPEYVLAGGGNTSYKENNVMAVKASGYALSTIDESGFVMMDTEKLRKLVDTEYPEDDKEREVCALKDMMDARLDESDEKRPSVECILHALFDERFVLHVHPALINGITCGKNGEAASGEILGDLKGSFMWVPLTKPGYILSKVCAEMLSAHAAAYGKQPSIVMLQNHGIFLAADKTGEIDHIMGEVVSRIDKKILRRPALSESAGIHAAYNDSANAAKNAAINELDKLNNGSSVIFMHNNEIAALTGSHENYSSMLKPFTPDHIVYCRAFPLFAESIAELGEAFQAYEAAHGVKPKIVVIRGLGVFALGKDANEACIASELYLDMIKIVVYSESFGGPLALPDYLTDFIINWESESYRQKKSF